MWSLAVLVSCFLIFVSSGVPEPLKCYGKHQVPRCVKPCPPETSCRNRMIAFSCANDPKPCTEKCVCEEGYYRNYLGDCISLAQCEQCDKPNEFYACNSVCDNECDKIATQNRTSCPIKSFVCVKQCYCDDEYARNSNGDCVPVSECPSELQCGLNEVPRRVCKCPPEESCKNRGRKYRCNARNNPCSVKCVCAKGYYRNSIGECITEAQCNQCNVFANEFYSCNSACDNVCETIDIQNRTNCPIKNKKCNEKCYCDDGYARDDGDNCVPVDECPASCDD